MSDALLTEISKKLSDIHAALKGGASAGAATSGGAATPTKTKDDTAAAKKAAAEKAAAAAADKTAKANAGGKAGNGAPAGTKAPGGKYTIEQVRDALREVATNPALGKQAALAILDENGGVDHLNKLKPENFDAVYEAAQVELKQQAAPEGSADGDDELGL